MKTFNHVGSDLQELKTKNIDGKRHYVTPNGSYISITSLLSNLNKDSISRWRKRVGETEANRISTKASRQGTGVHSICESYIKNEEEILDGKMPNEVEMFNSILPFSIALFASERVLKNLAAQSHRSTLSFSWSGFLSMVLIVYLDLRA